MNPQIQHATRSKRAQLRVDHTIEEKTIVARNVISGKWTYKHAATRSRVVVRSVQKWVERVKNDQQLHVNGGRPGYVSQDHKKRVIEEVLGNENGPVKCSKTKFVKKLQAAANATRIALNKPVVTLSPSYIRNFQNENDINEGNAEVIDNAHFVALHDPRHALSFAVMQHYLRKRVPNGLFVTFDKTRFDLPKSDQQTEKAVFLGRRSKTFKCATENKKNSQGNCSVQLIVVVNDAGKLAELVYLVKVNSMPKNSIDVHSAPVLDISNSSDRTAYLIFIGESTPNQDASLEWLIHNIVIPFIRQLRGRVPNGAQKPASLQVDGDPRQLQVLASVGVREALTAENTIPNKESASCTPTQAPLDEGNMFCSGKKRFRKLVKNGYYPKNEQEVEDLKEIFRNHLRKYPKKHKKGSRPSVALGRYFTDVIKCFYTVVEALRHSGVCALVRNSFETTGVAPFNPSVIRDKCQFTWTEAQKAQFVAAIPALSKIFETNFELKEKDFDDAGIPANNTSRDALPVHRRRALLLYAPHVLQDLQNQAERGSQEAL